MKKGRLIVKCVTYSILFFTMLFPIYYYLMLSIPYADDFSYSAYMRDYFVQDQNPFLSAFHAMSFYYNKMGGEWFSDYAATLFSQLEWNGILGLRLSSLFLHIAFECSLLFLIGSFCSIYCKANNKVFASLGLFAVVLYWVINNYCNTEIYTWNLICVKYLFPISIMCIGVGCYMRFLHNQRIRCWLPAMICGFLVNGSSLNIAVLNCVLYCILMIYGIARKGLKLKSIIASTVPLISLIITMVGPGNFERYGSQEFYVGGCILGCLSAILYRLAYLSLHTPFLVTVVLLSLWMIDQIQVQSSVKQIHRHPFLMFLVCFGCVILVDSPYVMSAKIQTFDYVQYEDRGIFVQDFAIYTFTIVWVLYFALYIKTKFPDLSIGKPVKTTCMIGGAALVALIVILNNPRELTTVRMWENIYNGSADRYARYQESIIWQIENTKDDHVLLVYDTSIAPRKDLLILGLRLSEDENRWDYWYNGAVAHFYEKEKVNIIYK